EPGAQSHADTNTEPLPERPSRDVRKRQARCGMAFQVAAELPQFQQVLDWKQTGFGPRGIKQRGCVALRKNKSVVIVIMRVLRVIPHVAKEQRGDHICSRAARSRVSAARGGGRVDGMNPQLV